MAKVNRAREYGDTQIKTAGKLKSLQMLHEGALRFLREAAQKPQSRTVNLTKARNIFVQLQMLLRLREDPLAELLFLLYDFLCGRLERGDDRSLQDAIDLLDHLASTFRLIGRQNRVAA